MLPMLTWSSWPRLVGIESTLAGWHSILFSLTRAAAVYCGIMKPELRPVSRISSFGKPVVPFEKQVDAPFGDAREFGQRDRGEIERERQRLAVEVAATEDVADLEDERIVGDAVHLGFEDAVRRTASASRLAP